MYVWVREVVMFRCVQCDAPADRDIPRPERVDITVIYLCHQCAVSAEPEAPVIEGWLEGWLI